MACEPGAVVVSLWVARSRSPRDLASVESGGGDCSVPVRWCGLSREYSLNVMRHTASEGTEWSCELFHRQDVTRVHSCVRVQ